MRDEQHDFWSRMSGRYDDVVDRQLGAPTRTLIRERLARETGLGRVVEIGCGTGFYTPTLAASADSVLATDVAPGMLETSRRRVSATNVTFAIEDCQRTSLPDGAFDTAFIGLVLHFTEPARTIGEMHRILRNGGLLLVANLDPEALTGVGRARSVLRVLYHGITGYRSKPPRGLGRNVVGERALCELLGRSGFRVVAAETVRDPSRPSSIPIDYVRAVRI